ncbi:MAG: 3-deoxy-7-phosphoheptulonate synthase [Candidatus Melainabacteria bacterium RIFOXYA12_FULL_32_12]|nr:MAG: 3-deoxy-7-phosphoheptulonate synthase [Candidatus Melainabacteria bacterium RIFOXYA2_FULL_32_9]OGI30995.1 MAG: 3-deoxy-7-phosphoheptulonate synthase [Candidatus Melainabacteria bacterium RIFOXYA12_FULL_32_12]
MLIVMQPQANEEQINKVIDLIKGKGFEAHVSKGEINTVIGAVGGKTIDIRNLELLEGVQEVVKITSSHKLASRAFKKENTVIKINDVEIGGDQLTVIAGPCTVESLDQMEKIAAELNRIGIRILRGGAFKPRTSPYSFQGLGEEGLKILKYVADKYNLIVTSEIMEISQIPLFLKYVDILQVGARNMQNFNLLRELGCINKPVLLKRGLSATIEEWLMSAEYIMSGGNRDVILCERGIRTFETATRNTLDISAIPVVKKLSHLPIVVDPSHAIGIRDKVAPLSRAAVAVGADGIMVEVHHDPDTAICDGAQSLYPHQFEKLIEQLKIIVPVVDKKL